MSTFNLSRPLRAGLSSALILAVSTQAGVALAAGGKHRAVADDGVVEAVNVAERARGPRRSTPYDGTGSTSLTELYGAGIEGFSGVSGELLPEAVAKLNKLKPASGANAPEVVLGMDTRVRVEPRPYPSRAVALITFAGGRCTGWFIGPDTVATAGHCVHTGGTSGRWVRRTSVRVYPGFDENTAPYGRCTARRLYSVRGWTRSRDERYDYGAIKLNCNIGNIVGWFGFLSRPVTTSMNDYPTTISGYPGDKPLQQWQSSDKVRATENRQIFYANDTAGGMSGSPIWFDLVGPYSIGIHAYGTHGNAPHSTYNHGTRIVPPVFNNLLNWKNAQ
jgi:glutamyl endopeptidase